MFKKFFIQLFITAGVMAVVFAFNFIAYDWFAARADSGQNTSGFAWSENIGWINFNGSGYGVNVDLASGKLSGFAWSENIGWISFNEGTTGAPPFDDPCSDATCIAKATPSGQFGKSSVPVIGWARALSYGGGWDGWIKFNHGQPNEAYIDTTGDWSGWAWGGDVVGWVNLNGGGYKVTTQLSSTNNPPTVSISAGNPGSHEVVNYCANSPVNIILNWNFNDPDPGDTQSAYQVQVTRLRDSAICDTGKQIGSLPSATALFINNTPGCGSNFIWYDTSASGYRWKAKVWDSRDEASGWSNTQTFSVPEYQYPSPDFNYSPSSPRQDENTQFSDNGSDCHELACTKWEWDFESDDSIDATGQTVIHAFSSSGDHQTTFYVTNSDNCVCPISKTIGTSKKLPGWREILPW